MLAGFPILVVALLFCAQLFRQTDGAPQSHAFGLPPGTVRAIIALALVLTFITLAFLVVQAPQTDDTAAQLIEKVFIATSTALATVLGFYFGSGGAKTAIQEMGRALGQQAGSADGDSLLASAEEVVKTAEAAVSRVKGAQIAFSAKLDEAKTKSDPNVAIMEVDLAEIDAAVAKAEAARSNASLRVRELKSLGRDLNNASMTARRDQTKAEIALVTTNLRDDAFDASAQADKAEDILARYAT